MPVTAQDQFGDRPRQDLLRALAFLIRVRRGVRWYVESVPGPGDHHLYRAATVGGLVHRPVQRPPTAFRTVDSDDEAIAGGHR